MFIALIYVIVNGHERTSKIVVASYNFCVADGALKKNGSFDFAKGGSGEGQKQMCHLCGWLKKFRAVGFFYFLSCVVVCGVSSCRCR
jgi:hypothetical protein